MALGTNSGNFISGTLIFLSPRGKDKAGNKVKPHFVVARKVGENIVDDTDTVSTVSGDLIRVEIKTHEFKGKISKEAVFYLRDKVAKETYRLPIYFRVSGRGLFNRLATLTEKGDFSNLQIDFYENKKGFEAYALSQGNEKVQWKYELEEVPTPIAILHPITGKLIENDYTPIDDFYAKELNAIAEKLGNSKTEASASSTTASAPQSENKTLPVPVAAGTPVDEDVPF